MFGSIVLGQATESIEHVYLPARREHRPPLVSLYLLALTVGVIGVAVTAPDASTRLANLLGGTFALPPRDAHSYVEYASLAFVAVSLFVLFRLLKKSAKRLALRDRLAGHFHEDE
jgi:hypothetical protein